MTTVVDSSVLVAATADGSAVGQWAEDIIADNDLAAPQLLYVESMNVLRRLENSKQLTPLEAASAYRDILQLDIELFPLEPFADRIWALRRTLTSHDAWYVAVAEMLDAPLATLDRRLARAHGPTCRFLFQG
jgi:predicted nucleic acid-binding protein